MLWPGFFTVARFFPGVWLGKGRRRKKKEGRTASAHPAEAHLRLPVAAFADLLLPWVPHPPCVLPVAGAGAEGRAQLSVEEKALSALEVPSV